MSIDSIESASTSNQHAFKAPTSSDLRSCCPALNALSNHSYIRHDGKDITFSELRSALCKVYNLSYVLGSILSGIAITFCGNPFRRTFDLGSICARHVLQHPAAMVHDDSPKTEAWGPSKVNLNLLQKLISFSSDEQTLSMDDLIKYRHKREETEPLNKFHQSAALAEVAILLEVFGGVEKKVPIDHLTEFMGGERLPKEWHKKERKIGLLRCQFLIRKLKACLARTCARKNRPNEEPSDSQPKTIDEPSALVSADRVPSDPPNNV